MRNILVLPAEQVRWLARAYIAHERDHVPLGFTRGRVAAQHWPYPCVRPLVQTCWRYSTPVCAAFHARRRWALSRARSTHALALQLHLFWAYMRWDELLADIPEDAVRCRAHVKCGRGALAERVHLGHVHHTVAARR